MESYSTLQRISEIIKKIFGQTERETKEIKKVVIPTKKDELHIKLFEGKAIVYSGESNGTYEDAIEWFHTEDTQSYKFYHRLGVTVVSRDAIMSMEYYPANMKEFLEKMEDNPTDMSTPPVDKEEKE